MGWGGDKEVNNHIKTRVGGMCMSVIVIRRVRQESEMDRTQSRRGDALVKYTVPDIPNTYRLEYIILKEYTKLMLKSYSQPTSML